MKLFRKREVAFFDLSIRLLQQGQSAPVTQCLDLLEGNWTHWLEKDICFFEDPAAGLLSLKELGIGENRREDA